MTVCKFILIVDYDKGSSDKYKPSENTSSITIIVAGAATAVFILMAILVLIVIVIIKIVLQRYVCYYIMILYCIDCYTLDITRRQYYTKSPPFSPLLSTV